MKRKNHFFKKLQDNHKNRKKAVALLIDPEKATSNDDLEALISQAVLWEVDFFFVGGSLLMEENLDNTILTIQRYTSEIPVILFPGSAIQVSSKADGILFLSLISGRNPEYLIGQQVVVAPLLAKLDLEIIPTAYLLINSEEITSVNYISQTLPIPNNKPNLAIATALAGKYLGLQYVFLDAGSGAHTPVSTSIIKGVKKHTVCPLIVGGGIDTVGRIETAFLAGADLVVLGNGVEKSPDFLIEALSFTHRFNLELNVDQ